ncbi:MAG TPA: hypothetical protein VMY87_09230 [Armatimonadota bacterium]|nr:hypothetical protein [Armatimonadota bacterium]
MSEAKKATSFRRMAPGLGYTAVLVACAVVEPPVVARFGPTGVELTWFAICPAALALVHVLGARVVEGGAGYWALAALWAGAAAFGLLARVEALGAATPWFSLARYALIGVAGLMFCVSVVAGRPLFVRSTGAQSRVARAIVGAMGVVALVVWVGVVGLVVWLTPFPVALAPSQPGATSERVWTGEWDDYLVWLAWSPDSRYVVGQGRGIWIVEPGEKRAVRLPHSGVVFYERPWSSSGEGFYFTREGTSEPGIWFATADGGEAQKVVDGHAGVPSCSPDGGSIAFGTAEGICVTEADGSGRRLVAEEGSVAFWSPDGRHILTVHRSEEGDSLWMVALEGGSRRLPVQVRKLDEMTWVGPDVFATIAVEEGPLMPLLGRRRTARVDLWDLEGKRLKTFALGGYLGDGGGQIAAAPDGRRLAVATDMLLAFGESLVVLDVESGEVRRLPAAIEGGGGLAWSHDGRALALSDVVERTHDDKFSYVAVIGGL